MGSCEEGESGEPKALAGEKFKAEMSEGEKWSSYEGLDEGKLKGEWEKKWESWELFVLAWMAEAFEAAS